MVHASAGFLRTARRFVPWTTCILCLAGNVPGRAQDAPPATEPSPQNQVLIAGLLANPRDAKLWKPFADASLQDQAWPILTYAVRHPKHPPLELGFIIPPADPSNVLEAMTHINGPRSAAFVIELARTCPDIAMRREALGLLNYPLKLNTPEAQKVIRESLADADPGIMAEALGDLANLPDPQAVAMILKILRDPPAETPRGPWDQPTTYNAGFYSGYTTRYIFDSALDAIAGSGSPEALNDLKAMLQSPSAFTRSRACTAIASCAQHADPAQRQTAVDALTDRLNDYNPGTREAAAKALANMGDHRAIPQLILEVRYQSEIDPQWRIIGDGHWPFEAIQRLETLTGLELGGSRGEAFWDAERAGTEAVKAIRDQAAAAIQLLTDNGYNSTGPSLPTKLTAADRVFLEGLLANRLVDPRGATYIKFERPVRNCWGRIRKGAESAWLFPASENRPAACVLGSDRESFPLPSAYTTFNFVEDCRRKIAEVKTGKSDRGSSVDAALLYRLGQEELAAQTLFVSRGCGDKIDTELNAGIASDAWQAFNEGINAYIVRDDDTAWDELDRLRSLYPDYLDSYGQGAKLLAELERRRKEGAFNAHAPAATMPAVPDRYPDNELGVKVPAHPFTQPDGFEKWTAQHQADWLIHELQELDARQEGQPGGVDVTSDPRVTALIRVGEPAIPALIECIDNDGRLTRSVSFWRDFSRLRTIVSVRECALSAAESILGTSVFEPATTGDNFTKRGEERAHETARQLREYWAKYGKIPYAQRMMNILTDPKSTINAQRSAAYALAHANEERRIGTMVGTGGAKAKGSENPVVEQFSDPTVADEILSLHGRELDALSKGSKAKGEKPDQWQVDHIHETYADMLTKLNDRRAAPAVMFLFDSATTPGDKRLWATVCHSLGEERPMEAIASAFTTGDLNIGPIDPAADLLDRPEVKELTQWLQSLAYLDTRFADQAIDSLATKTHPYHAAVTAIVRELSRRCDISMDYEIWMRQRFAIEMARPLLEDITSAGAHYKIAGKNEMTWNQAGVSGGSGPVPSEISDPATRQDEADARICDLAAMHISERILGANPVHPLQKDRDARVAALRNFLDQYGSSLQRLPSSWTSSIVGIPDDVRYNWLWVEYYPALLIRGRAATPADVAAGKAIFSLGVPGGAPDDRPLPMIGMAKDADGKAALALVLQAEKDHAGKLHCGIVTRRQIREASDDELTNIQPPGK